MSWGKRRARPPARGLSEHERLNADAFIESNYNQKASQEKAAELMKTYPDLKGMFVTSATDLPALRLAVEEAAKQNEISVAGERRTDANKDYLETGALDVLGCWDPADTAVVMCKVGEMIKNGEEIVDGMDLGVPGYNSVKVEGNVIIGQAWKDITMDSPESDWF